VLFWVFAVLALGAAIAVITMRNIVHGALMLVLNLLAIAGLYLTLESSFLSIIQVLVYAGAIMVLFLFVIMLLGVDNDDLLTSDPRAHRCGRRRRCAARRRAAVRVRRPLHGDARICAAGRPARRRRRSVDCVGLAEAYGEDDARASPSSGAAMFTRYTFPFELSALLLTVATIGAVILARRATSSPRTSTRRTPPDAPTAGPDAAEAGGRGRSRRPASASAAHGSEPGDDARADDDREG
jgi:NADH-quinone oxidoreductase subunit J